ncbi:MAG: RNA polymerase sigma factor [Defluviitaleaceae bacterium]|nr:RNA polymerase sigma factor [Defluviitaleaceae bacterium]
MFSRTGKKQYNNNDNESTLEGLIAKAVRGDRRALSELCEEIARSVLLQMTYILGDKAEAEDVSQEVLIRVCENIRSLRNPKAFKGWLSRIMINEKNRYLAKHLKLGAMSNIDDYLDYFEGVTEDQSEFIPHKYVENEEMGRIVMNILSDLPMRQKEAIVLHYYNDLSTTEVAEVMKVTTQSVSKTLKIAREKLKNELEGQAVISEYVNNSRSAKAVNMN